MPLSRSKRPIKTSARRQGKIPSLREIIGSRVRLVQTALQGVRRHRDEPEQLEVKVHKLRVACRKTVAAIDGLKPMLPKKPARKLRKRLKLLRRACGDRRDADVMIRLIQEHAEGADRGMKSAYRALGRLANLQRVSTTPFDVTSVTQELHTIEGLTARLFDASDDSK